MRVVPFIAAHIDQMRVQPGQKAEAEAQAPGGYAWTAMDGDTPIACAGLLDLWPGRAYAWALLSSDAGPHMCAITREVRRHLDEAPYARIEMAVSEAFEPGARWAELLGFVRETPEPMRAYFPNGNAAWLYARCR